MTTQVPAPKHRAAGRATTPLTPITSSLEGAGRKTAVILASSGMLAAATAVPAGAAPGPADLNQFNQPATSVIGAGSVAAAPATANWALDVPTITITEAPEADKPVEMTWQATPKPPPAPARAAAKPAKARGPVGSPPPQTVQGNVILEIAAQYVGVPYVYGGSGPSGFDCSGFVQFVYGQAGRSVPRTDSQIHNSGTIISRDQAQPGDIIWHPGHVAIYAGGGMQIDAPHTGSHVQFRSISTSNPVFIRF